MSRSIDQRIVDMQFNNKQFESGISESMGSLDNLKKGLGGLGDGALSGLATGVDTIASRFSTLGIIGMEVLQRITNAVIDLGVQMVKSLALEPIMQGFTEYELKMGAIQTIMAGSGEDLQTVNKYLDELNTYADRTIYSFADMTQNIGKFTNAGVKLEDSVAAIQGISNLAAVSGANANEASRAMYNFAQSISGGFVKLIDWKSIENANMATVEFKNYLLEAGVAAGTLERQANGMYKVLSTGADVSATLGFNDALKDQWLTTDVLVSTLSAYADETTDIGKKAFAAAQDVKTFSQLIDTMKEAVGSGWAQTFEIIIGDFEEAKALWTGINNVVSEWIDQSADARNNLLRGWDELGGRAALIESLKNIFEGLMSVIKPISEAFGNIFPPMTAERLYNLTEGLRAFTERLTLSDETSDKLRRTFEGLFTILGFIGDAFSFLFGVVGKVVGKLAPAGEGFLGITAAVGDFLVNLRETGSVADGFQQALEVIGDILDWIDEKIRLAVSKIAEYFGQFSGIDLGPLRIFSGEVETQFRPFTFVADVFKTAVEGIVNAWQAAQPFFQKIKDFFGPILTGIADGIKNFAAAAGINSFADLFNPAMLATIVFTIKKFVDTLTESVGGAKGLLEGITNILDGVRGSLEAYQSKLKSQALLNIAIAVGILAASLYLISSLDPKEMAVALAGITTLFIELSAVMIVMSKSMGSIKLGGVAVQMVAVATAVLILAAACKSMAELDWDELTRGLFGVAALLLELVMFTKLMGDGKGLTKVGIAMIPLATGLLIMSQAVKSLASLDWDELMRGLMGLGVVLLELTMFMKLMGDGKGIMKIGLAMIPLATGVLILSQAIKTMAGLSWEELAKGLLGLAGALLVIAGATKIVDEKAMLAMGVAMIGVGAGLAAIAGAMLIMATMSWEELAKGLVGVGGALLIIAGATKLMNPVNMLALGVSLVGVGAGLAIIGGVMTIFGGMSWEEIAKGLIMLAGSLTILAVASNAMTGAIAGAASMLVMAAALAVLTPSLVILGSMDLENIGLALLTLAGVFAIFGVAALVLTPVAPIMLALGAAVGLLGVGVLALGAGLLALSLAMTAFAAAGAAGMAALSYVLETLIMFIPTVAVKVGEGIVAILGVLVEAIPLIVEAIGLILAGVLDLLIEYTPKIMETLGVILTEVIALLVEYVPLIAEGALKIILGILQVMAENIQPIVEAALALMEGFLKGVAEGLPGVVTAAVDVIVAFLTTIGEQLPRIIDAGVEMIIDFINGMADTIRTRTPEMVTAIGNLASAIIEGLVGGLGAGVKAVVDAIVNVGKALWNGFKNFFGIKSPSTLMESEGGNVVGGLFNGLKAGIGKLGDIAKDIGGAIFNGIKGAVSNIGDIASNIVSTLGDGIKNGIGAIGNAAKSLGNSILGGIKGVLGINSPASTMIDAAGDVGDGLIIGFRDIMMPVQRVAENVGEGVADSMTEALGKVADALDPDMVAMNPTITPVIDMTQVERGLANTFDNPQNLNVGEIKGAASTVSGISQNGSRNDTTSDTSSNSRIAAMLDGFDQNMRELISKVGKLQVVMDTGTLVGAIGPDMDRELGSLANMTRRGVK